MKSKLANIESNTGRFIDGNPATGTLGTIVTAKFLNDVQEFLQDTYEEIKGVLELAGVPVNVSRQDQLAVAIRELLSKKQDALVRHRLDLTALDAGLYHLVTFFPTGAQMDGRRWQFQILRPLRGLGNVTWATHNGGGFSLQIGWSSNASGWGANGLYRVIDFFEYAFTPQSPIIGIGQNTNASVEYCYLRGGSVYFADAPAGFEVVVQTEAVTRNGITLAPSREFDARLMPVVDVKQAREVVPEAVRHKNLESLIPGRDVRWDRAAPHELPNGTYMGLGRRAILNVDDGTYTGWQMVSRVQEPWQSVRFGANNNRFFFQQAKSETEWREAVEMLFARPQLPSNLNDALLVGVYPQPDQSLTTTARNYPISQPGQLWVTPCGDSLQQRYVATSGETFQRQRIGTSGTQWSRWTRVDGAEWADIRNRPWNAVNNLATRDLDEMTEFGIYGQIHDANATEARHYPEQAGGSLLVTPSAFGVLQEYTTWSQNTKYVRGRDSNGWRPWRRVDGQDCVAKSGDTMTGNLQLSVGDYSFINQYNTAGKHARIETLPDRESNFYKVSYWEGLNDLYAAFFPKRGKYETVAYESWVNQLLAANFTRSWYPDHYAGTEVYKARQWGLMITVMNTTAANKDVELPEAYTGHAIVIASDRGDGRVSLSGSRFLGGNRIRLTGRNDTHCHVLVIGSIG